MKIQTTKEKLDPVLSQAERVVSRAPTLPVLGCLHLSAEKGSLRVSATNLDLSVEFSIPVKMEKSGAAALHANALRALVSGARPGSSIEIEAKDGVVLVTTAQQRATLKTLPHEEFPSIPKMEQEKAVVVDAEHISRALRAVWYSAAVSSVKQELASVYVYSEKDTLVTAATDGVRLAEKRCMIKGLPEGISFLLPVKNIQEISRILEEGRGNATLCFSEHQMGIYHDTYYLSARVTEGAFPDYKAIIPKQSVAEVIVLKQDIVAALKTLSVFTNALHQVRIDVFPEKKEFHVTAQNSDTGEYNERIDAALLKGEDISVTVNHRYFLECFQSIGADSVSLSLSGAMKPVVVRGISDASFLYLLMPMSV